MELGDVPGESRSKNHENWIVCEGLEFGVKQAESQSTRGKSMSPSSAEFSEITLKRQLDVSSPDLFVSAAGGRVVGEATIELTNETGGVSLRLVLRDVAVSSYSVELADGKLFEEIKVTYVGGIRPWKIRPPTVLSALASNETCWFTSSSARERSKNRSIR